MEAQAGDLGEVAAAAMTVMRAAAARMGVDTAGVAEGVLLRSMAAACLLRAALQHAPRGRRGQTSVTTSTLRAMTCTP
jgi:hypothetical protein